MEKMTITEMVLIMIGLLFGSAESWRCLQRSKITGKGVIGILIVYHILSYGVGGYLMYRYGYHVLKMIRYWVLLEGLFLIAVIDGKERIIPNPYLLVLLGLRTILLIAEWMAFPEAILEIVLSAGIGLVGGTVLFAVTGLLMRNGMGMGDVKLVGVLGYYLGFQVLMSNLVIILTLTVVTGVVLIVMKKVSLRSEIPFAPFVAAGTLLTVLMGF